MGKKVEKEAKVNLEMVVQ